MIENALAGTDECITESTMRFNKQIWGLRNYKIIPAAKDRPTRKKEATDRELILVSSEKWRGIKKMRKI